MGLVSFYVWTLCFPRSFDEVAVIPPVNIFGNFVENQEVIIAWT